MHMLHTRVVVNTFSVIAGDKLASGPYDYENIGKINVKYNVEYALCAVYRRWGMVLVCGSDHSYFAELGPIASVRLHSYI